MKKQGGRKEAATSRIDILLEQLSDFCQRRVRQNTSTTDFRIETLENRLLLSADLPVDLALGLAKSVVEPPAQLLVVDGSLLDRQSLLNALSGGEQLILDPARDGIEQITHALTGRSDIAGIQILSHGSSGSITLGSTTLNAENLETYSSQLHAWAVALTADADIVLYGCDVAAGDGVMFLDEFSRLTGADIAASTNPTGSAALGGDWNLEYETGAIESQTISEEMTGGASLLLGTVHVSTSGADSNAGGAADPFRTIGRAVVAAAASSNGQDIIKVEGGIYNSVADQSISIPSSGNIDSLLIQGGFDPTFTTRVAGTTIYIPQNAGNVSAADVDVLDDGVAIDGIKFVFDGTLGPGGTRESGGILSRGKNLTFANNTVEIGSGNASSDAFGLQTFSGSNQGTLNVTGNVFESNNAGAFHSGGIYLNPGAATSVLIDGNTVFGSNLFRGIADDSLSNVTISNNKLFRTGPAADFDFTPFIYAGAFNGSADQANVTISGNLINRTVDGGVLTPFDNTVGIEVGNASGNGFAISGVSLTNNTVQNTTRGLLVSAHADGLTVGTAAAGSGGSYTHNDIGIFAPGAAALTLRNLTASGNLSDGLRAFDLTGTLNISDSSFSNNDADNSAEGDGIDLTNVQDVIFLRVTAIGNDPGVLIFGAASFSDTDGVYTANDNHGIWLIDIAGSVALVRTTANDNDANNDGIGDGVNMTDGPDADTNAVGSLSVTGGSFSNTAAAGEQRFGIRVGDGIGIGAVHSVAGSVAFQSDSIVGPLQHVSVTGNQSSGVEIEDGGTTASITGAGNYNANFNAGVVIASLSGGFTAADSTFSGNTNHGIQLIDIGGLVSLTRVTANDDDANLGGIGDGVNMTDGPDAGTDAVGSLLVVGGSFSDTAAAGAQRYGIRVGDGIGVGSVHSVAGSIVFQSDSVAGPLQNVSITGNQNSGVEIEDGGTTASISGTGNYSGNGAAGPNQGAGFAIASLSGSFTAPGSTFSNNTSQGLSLAGVGDVNLTGISANDNTGDGIRIIGAGNVTTNTVTATGNDPGVFVNTALSYTDIAGIYTGNDTHGIQLIDIVGLVSLTRTTANDNDANNDSIGDGVNMTDGPDADTNAVGSLSVTGGSFSNTAAAGEQRFGIRVGDGIGIGAVHSVAGSVAFQSDSIVGPLQHVSVTGNQSSGVEIGDGGTTASITGAGNYNANFNAGVVIASLSGGFTAADSTFSGNTNHGIQLIDIGGLVSLTRVTANDDDANLGGIGDGVNMTDGPDAGTDAVGSLLVVGGSFSDTAAAGAQRYGIRVGDGIGVGSVHSVAGSIVFQSDSVAGPLQNVSITGNQNSGVEIEDGGTTASISGTGNYSGNGAAGPNQGAGFAIASLSGSFTAPGSTFSNNTSQGLSLAGVGDVNLTGISANDNTGDGIRIIGAGNITTNTVTATGNDPGVFVNTALSYTDIAGIYTGNDTHGIQLIDIVGLVSLTRTTANDNDANNDSIGDGVNMTDGGDADTNAIGSLSVTGGSFSNTAAAGEQRFGIRVGDGIGIGAVHSVAGSVAFQSDSIVGPLQHVSVTGNQSSGVEIEDGGTTASITGAGNYNANFNAGVVIASLSGGFTAADSTFSGNTNHGIQLIDIGGLVSLTRVTANDDDANLGGIGDGVNMTDGPDAGTDAVGSLLVVGGSFSDTAAAGAQRFGIRVGDGIGVGSVHSVAGSIVFQSDSVAGPLQNVSITGNQNSGVEIEDGGTTASISGTGNYSGNGAAGPNQGAGFAIASLSSTFTLTGNLTASNNSGDGINVSTSGTILIAGSLDTGTDPIVLTAPGGVTFDSSSVLYVDLGGTSAGAFTKITISHAVTLDGTLNAELVGGFSPVSGDRFRFMTFASRTGFFAATILPAEFVVDQSNATDLELVFNPNVAPVANNDTYTTDSNTPLLIAAPGVLANDTDADGDALTAILVTGPTHGALIFHADGSFLYTPNSGFVGADTFTYRADDGTDLSGPANVTINVVPLSTIVGLVYEDANNNGHVDSGEQGIAGVTIHLTGTDYLGQSVNLTTTTDTGGVYTFAGLRRGTYSLAEAQPSGYTDGVDSVGTVNGVVTGNNAVNDTFSGIVITSPSSSAENYNFGERANVGVLQADETAGIGFWRNNNGRALLVSLNGGPNSTALGDWLASNFSNMWGANAGANNLAGKTNTQVADFYRILFEQSKTDLTQAGLGGPPKMDAQVMAVAFAVYVTDTNLAGTAATSYGFVVDASGTGARTFNVGSSGAAFGFANGTQARIFDLLLAANDRAFHGVLYDADHDGDANSSLEVMFRTMANVVFSGINETGSI